MYNPEVKQRFRALRKRLGLNQEEMALKLGKTQTSISHIEGGKFGIALDTLEAMETQLGVNREWMTRGQGPMLLEDLKPSLNPSSKTEQEVEALCERFRERITEQSVTILRLESMCGWLQTQLEKSEHRFEGLSEQMATLAAERNTMWQFIMEHNLIKKYLASHKAASLNRRPAMAA